MLLFTKVPHFVLILARSYTLPILQVRKLRLGEGKESAQAYTAGLYDRLSGQSEPQTRENNAQAIPNALGGWVQHRGVMVGLCIPWAWHGSSLTHGSLSLGKSQEASPQFPSLSPSPRVHIRPLLTSSQVVKGQRSKRGCPCSREPASARAPPGGGGAPGEPPDAWVPRAERAPFLRVFIR